MNQTQPSAEPRPWTPVEVNEPCPGTYLAMKRKGRRSAWKQFPTVALRNAEMLRRYAAGETLAGIGATLGYTRERVRQIVKFAGVVMPRGLRCAVKECGRSTRAPRLYCRIHQQHFDPQGTPSARSSARVMKGQLGGRQMFPASTRNQLRRLREQGHAYETVARLLNEAGMCAPHGGPWCASSVRRTYLR